MEEYSKEQLWELYEQLPGDLQKAVFSEEIGEKTENILRENNIEDSQKITKTIKSVGYVFLGLMAPEELKENILKKELKIKKEIAENIFSAINNEIFLSLKNSLEALYETKIKGQKTFSSLQPKKLQKKDAYREPIE